MKIIVNKLIPLSLLILTIQSHAASLNVITADPNGKPAGGSFNEGYSLSKEGRYIVFSSNKNLSLQDTNSSYDIYVRDTVANKTLLVSVDLTGKAAGR